VTATMSAAVDGKLTIHPWLHEELSEHSNGILGEDVFSLVVARSKARGLASFSGQEPPSARWGHNDAGGDWTQDETVRRLAWFQCAVPERPLAGRRIPIQPVFSVLDEVLSLVGIVDLKAVHVIAPLAAAPDGRFDVAALARCFDFAAPTTARSVSVLLSVPKKSLPSLQPLLGRVRAQSSDRIGADEAEAAALSSVLPPYGMPWLLGDSDRVELAARCTLPTWSIDAASWLIETFLEALRELRLTDPIAVSAILDSS
jgi:hypothetical protein